MLAMHKQRSVLQGAFGRYSEQMEEELEQLVRFLLRKQAEQQDAAVEGPRPGAALPRHAVDAVALLEKLRAELDVAERERKERAVADAARAQAMVDGSLQARYAEITPEEAMRQLASARPAVWLKLKETEARLRGELAAEVEPEAEAAVLVGGGAGAAAAGEGFQERAQHEAEVVGMGIALAALDEHDQA
jgi:hypothetical protein